MALLAVVASLSDDRGECTSRPAPDRRLGRGRPVQAQRRKRLAPAGSRAGDAEVVVRPHARSRRARAGAGRGPACRCTRPRPQIVLGSQNATDDCVPAVAERARATECRPVA